MAGAVRVTHYSLTHCSPRREEVDPRVEQHHELIEAALLAEGVRGQGQGLRQWSGLGSGLGCVSGPGSGPGVRARVRGLGSGVRGSGRGLACPRVARRRGPRWRAARRSAAWARARRRWAPPAHRSRRRRRRSASWPPSLAALPWA
eukprot:scaffold119471_cov72-Phaeocystis_antarctica.AAC.2